MSKILLFIVCIIEMINVTKFLQFTAAFFIGAVIACGPSQEEYQNLKNDNKKIKTELINTKSELDQVKQNLEECTLTIEELKNTPTERLSKARSLQAQDNESEAEKEFKKIIEKYPDSNEAKVAKFALQEIEKRKEEERIAREKEHVEAEKKKRLGFKALKVENPVIIKPLKIKINTIKASQRWTSDRYNYRYHYRDARRGYKYIVADLSITSDVHNPELPPIDVYKTSSDKLSYIGTLRYEFYRWKDYGSYLGNNADYGNDFSHTKTIRFVAGLEISEEELKDNAIFILINDQVCFSREHDRFGNPAVKYSGVSCKYSYSLNLEEVEKNYHLVKIFNKEKI